MDASAARGQYRSMMIYGGGYTGPKELVYLFVDAGCLRATCDAYSERYLGVAGGVFADLSAMLNVWGCSKGFYYDAVPAREHGEPDEIWLARIEPRMNQLRAIRALDGWHAPVGDLRGKKARQKKVDVMIAVDVLLHTVRRNMHRCVLLAGDVDFQPLVEAVVREGMTIRVWHPGHAAEDLYGAADAHTAFGGELLNCLRLEDGTELAAQQQHNFRPQEAERLFSWDEGDRRVEVSMMPDRRYLLEVYEPAAAGLSYQFRGEHLRSLAHTACDRLDVTIPEEVSNRL